MPIVTLTTDFGTKDYFVGMLKGTMLRLCANLTIIDISHNIQPFNITEAAFVLKNSFSSFPDGTVHVVSVNDQDERTVRYIAAEYRKHFFIGFDNGILSMIFEKKPDAIVEISHEGQNGTMPSFPWKNVFAKAACRIAEEGKIADIGKPLNALLTKTGLTPVVQDSLIRGSIIYIDSFHNVVVNVSKELFESLRRDRNYTISFRREKITSISESYHDVPEGEKLCLFNSAGYLEIAINSGKASSLLGLNIGDTVLIDFE
ncbi:MAG TPA: SAM-dependent chlorinase/fluorinase [Chitinophagales bacterium]|nr:SAM-dependent chlorinase/fluorinase [Chitinophagales bacterium]